MKDYVKDLRSLIGNRPVILAGSCVLLLNEDGHILFNRRTDNGFWGLPGGLMELGESLEDAARRELREECGVQPKTLAFFDIFSGPELFYEYPNGDQVHNVTSAYVAHGYIGTLRADQTESSEVRFFPPDRLPDESEISPPLRPVLRAYLKSISR